MKTTTLIFVAIILLMKTSIAQEKAPVAAGNAIITGIVVDKKTQTPIEYANIILYNQLDSTMINGTITNPKGKFVLSKLPYGNFYIVIDYIGYKKITFSNIALSINQKEHNLKAVALEEATSELGEVNVVSTQNTVEYKIDKRVINVAQNTNNVGGTAIEVLQNTPSVKTDVNGDITLRGSSNFTVLVDGRPSIFQGADALRQIPANTIDKIEMITNPSAKYDPEGNSGIINIITKKQKANGLNGIVNASVGTGNRYSSDFLLNFKTTKANLFIGADYRDIPNDRDFDVKRNYSLGDTIIYNSEKSGQLNKRPTTNLRFGLDYNFNENNTLTFNNVIGNSKFYRDFEFQFKTWNNQSDTSFYSVSDQIYDLDANYYNPSLSYTHKFKPEGNELSAEFAYTYLDGSYVQDNKEFDTDILFHQADANPTLFKSNNLFSRNDYMLKLDYQWKVNETSNLEAGLQGTINEKDVTLNFKDYNYLTNDWENNTAFSNDIVFSQKVYAGYLTFSKEIFKTNIQLGARAEVTDRILDQKTLNKNYDYNKLHFFPTLHLSKSINEKLELQLSYSRRIQRPTDFLLNPFPSNSNSNIMIIGNPELEPEFTDSYEFNIQKVLGKYSVSMNNYYRETQNAMSQVVTLNNQGVQILSFGNLNFNKFLGSEISASMPVAKWLNLSPAVDIFYTSSEGMIGNYKASFNTKSFAAQLNATVLAGENTRFQFNGGYNGKGITQQGEIDPMYSLSASVRRDFFQKKLSVVLQVREFFGSGIFKIYEYGGNFNNQIVVTPEKNVISINISYKINKYRRNNKLQQTTIDVNQG